MYTVHLCLQNHVSRGLLLLLARLIFFNEIYRTINLILYLIIKCQILSESQLYFSRNPSSKNRHFSDRSGHPTQLEPVRFRQLYLKLRIVRVKDLT